MKKVYAVYDLDAQKYQQPFYFEDDVQAKREFLMACRNENSYMKQFPDSYELRRIGKFNEVKGKFENIQPKKLMKAGEAMYHDNIAKQNADKAEQIKKEQYRQWKEEQEQKDKELAQQIREELHRPEDREIVLDKDGYPLKGDQHLQVDVGEINKEFAKDNLQ